ncbi:MAG TPA: PQ-loop domain-containing transporter [Candidatus Eisenbacteria bacterium]|nr:PQ-loop domain-containing transporter [Candidatus Eisenbacteria bacterium]
MVALQPIEMLGLVAGCCTTFAFVPQIVKIHRQGGRDLSYGMLAIFLIGVGLWLAYGLLIHAPSVILANAVTAALVVLAILLKAWKARGTSSSPLVPGQLPERG